VSYQQRDGGQDCMAKDSRASFSCAGTSLFRASVASGPASLHTGRMQGQRLWVLCQCGLFCRSDEEPCSSGSTDSGGEPGHASGRPAGNAAPSSGTARGRVGSGAGSGPGRPAHPAAAKDSAGSARGGAAARRGGGGRGRARAPGAASGRGRGAGEASRPKAGPGGLAAKGAPGAVPHKRPSGTFSRLAEPSGASAAGLAHRAVGKKHKGAMGFAQRWVMARVRRCPEPQTPSNI